ncbi:MAG: sulfatase [Candidatus Aminicenantes bacterium]|nr:MAG: sulfatase [Candidatus Aminicenantes bacterium]
MRNGPGMIKPFIFLMTAIMVSGFVLEAKADLKNIIIISVDTLRADHLGCYGYPLNTSPNIDTLSLDGIRFSHCYTVTPLTAPSFATLFTSLPPYKHGSKRNGLSTYRNVKTLPYFLKRFGYYSAAFISNWPLRKKLLALHQDFDEYVEVFTRRRFLGIFDSEGEAPEVTEKAIDWLEKKHKKRFLLWVHYTEPHRPYVSHKNFTFDYQHVPAATYPPGTKLKRIKKYDSEIAYADFYIGKLLEKIKSLGLYHDALIIFHSDHGESFGEHDYYYHGRRLYNSTVHVPLVIKLPGSRLKNTVRHEIGSILDISPTIFSILNIPVYSKMEGISLFREGLGSLERTILFETYWGSVHRKRKNEKFHLKVKPIRYALLNRSTKLIYNLKKKAFEAYHLKDDPFESQNVVTIGNKNPDLEDMKQALVNSIDRINKYIKVHRLYRLQDTSLSKQDLEMLKSLGYIE